MKALLVVLAAYLVASPVSAQHSYTGICFLDALLNAMDSAYGRITNAINPTTTTTTTESTTTTTESTTTTTETTTTTVKTTTTTSTTTTTVFAGACMSEADCPQTQVQYTCNPDDNIIITTTNFVCLSPGPTSQCKGRTSTPRIHKHCQGVEKCVRGLDHCVET